MPSNIVEHDCREDLAYIETYGVRYSPYQQDKYVSGVTVCYQEGCGHKNVTNEEDIVR